MGFCGPWEHFIPVRQDLSDVEVALESMEDVGSAKRRANACYEALIENRSLRYSSLVNDVMEEVERSAADRGFQEAEAARFMVTNVHRLPSQLQDMLYKGAHWLVDTFVPARWRPATRRVIKSSLRRTGLAKLLNSDVTADL